MSPDVQRAAAEVEAALPGLPLDPAHLEDLRRSGLSEDTIRAAGIRSLSATELSRYLGHWAGQVTSAYIIPYPETNFYRMKLFPPVLDGSGSTMRYFQPAGTPPHLYFGFRSWTTLADPSVPLVVTEGEKKTLKADQEGLTCIGLGGLWNWLQNGTPVADLGRIDWTMREVWVVPDSDVWLRFDLRQPVYALGKELESRGATVLVVKLPAGENGAKVGLDDFLVAQSVEAFRALPRLGLKHTAWLKEVEWWRVWKKRKASGQAVQPAPNPEQLAHIAHLAGAQAPLPVIDAGDLNLPRVAALAWQALQAANRPPTLFRRGSLLVRFEAIPHEAVPVRLEVNHESEADSC